MAKMNFQQLFIPVSLLPDLSEIIYLKKKLSKEK